MLTQFLPELPEPGAPPDTAVRVRSRWTSTFAASLELARQGEAVLEQDGSFSRIQISRSHPASRTAFSRENP
jgi:chromatin segregation and condensation protein Rec8/ScpA/Scc1 (kleisin family)